MLSPEPLGEEEMECVQQTVMKDYYESTDRLHERMFGLGPFATSFYTSPFGSSIIR